jgi:hypothetical protein
MEVSNVINVKNIAHMIHIDKVPFKATVNSNTDVNYNTELLTTDNTVL